MKYVLITLSFLSCSFAISVFMMLVLHRRSWIGSYSTMLGAGLLICFILNIVGSIQGLKRYRKTGTSRRERIAMWLNIGLVLLFMGALWVPNAIDLYNAFN